MNLRELREALHAKKIHNEWELASRLGESGADDLVIVHTPHSRQTMLSFGTYLHFVHSKVKVRAPFDTAFAERQYLITSSGIKEWVRSPFGCAGGAAYIPKSLMDKAKAYVK